MSTTTNLTELLRTRDEIEQMLRIFENDETITLEASMSFGQLFSRMGESIAKAFKRLLNFHTSADVIAPKQHKAVYRIIDRKGISAMAEYRVYRIAKQSAPNHELINLLSHQIGLLSDIEERLYKPLSRWLAGSINDPDDFAEKPWVDRDLGFLDIEKMRKSMSDLFVPENSRTDDSEFTNFINMYPSVKKFDECNKAFYELYQKVGDVNLGSLRKTEELLMRRLNSFIDLDQDPDSEFIIEKNTRKKLAQTFRAIAIETEYLMATFFLVAQAIGQWNNTIDLLEENLR